ncbi:Outer membrane protein assembly factor YaeT precursor [hydrothermal vent metagenome]|uniref:Outer membrane protein assembly factor YaeT n=1 Tax=hydrothermal vent metagenome TaxID=652676 RepID=A0A3B0RPU4_9ZZZZ
MNGDNNIRLGRLTGFGANALKLLLLLAGLVFTTSAQAQVTADWTNLGLGNFAPVPNGDTLTVGPRTITINQSSTVSGGTFTPHYSSDFLSYYTGNISTQIGPLLYSFDNSDFDAADKMTTTYTFDTAVTGLNFRLLDVDRNIGLAQDGVEVYYDTGSGIFQNAANTTAFYTVGSTNSRVSNGYMTGFLGNSASGLNSTAGDVNIDFGATSIKRVRIVYFSGQSETGNPSGPNQYIGLSDMVFDLETADLSLNKTVSNTSPTNGSNITYTLQLSSAVGSTTATNVTVSDVLPAGTTFVSSSGYGTYNSGTGIWSVPSIAANQTRTLSIVATVSATSGATIINSAEVASSPHFDPDSTPGNNSTNEDDDDTASFTVAGARTAGTPPTLVCPNGNVIFDWNTRAWTSGATNTSYPVTGIGSINFALSTDGVFVAPSPDDTTNNSGGFGATQQSLYQFLEFTNRSQTATTVLTLPTAVPGLQFVVLDIDFANNDFADKVTVTGSFNGTTVIPILTNGIANYVVGNTAIGDAGSGGTSANGNVWVTFNQPVDTVTIVYGNHTTAPADPDGQAASIYDFNFCNPETTLSVTKISSIISDPFNGTTNPKAIPGAIIQYCILISNAGSATATSISATDNIPGDVIYSAGTMLSGSNCGSAATAEDDDATGADETDPIGASVSGAVLTTTAASLGPAEGYALTFQVTVN